MICLGWQLVSICTQLETRDSDTWPSASSTKIISDILGSMYSLKEWNFKHSAILENWAKYLKKKKKITSYFIFTKEMHNLKETCNGSLHCACEAIFSYIVTWIFDFILMDSCQSKAMVQIPSEGLLESSMPCEYMLALWERAFAHWLFGPLPQNRNTVAVIDHVSVKPIISCQL